VERRQPRKTRAHLVVAQSMATFRKPGSVQIFQDKKPPPLASLQVQSTRHSTLVLTTRGKLPVKMPFHLIRSAFPQVRGVSRPTSRMSGNGARIHELHDHARPLSSTELKAHDLAVAAPKRLNALGAPRRRGSHHAAYSFAQLVDQCSPPMLTCGR